MTELERGSAAFQPYEPRSFRFLELWSLDDWRLKLYGIAYRRERPRHELIAAAKKVAAEILRANTSPNYKLGFVGVHEGCTVAVVFVDFWGNENELFHRVFMSRGSDPAALRLAGSSESSVCVWDLHLQAFEREAWIKHVLKKTDAPDFDAYLAERLNGDV